MPGATPSRWRRAARGTAAAIGALLVFVCALPCAVLVHAGAPPMRRLASVEVNRALQGKLRGQLEIRSIRRVGLDGVDDVSAAVRDAEGRVVTAVDGATVRVWLPSLAWTALRGRGLLSIRLRDVRIRNLDVTLLPGPDGEPTLVHAVEPVPTTPQAHPRPLRLDVSALRLESAHVHGRLGPFADFAARLSAIDASFAHDEHLTAGRVSQADATVTGLAPQPVRASLRADFSIPSSGTPHAHADVEARVGDLPLTATAELTGSRIDAKANASATRDALEGLAPALASLAPAAARAEVHGTLSAAHASARVVAAVGTLDATADVRRRGPANRVTFDAHAAIGDLARVPGLDRRSTGGSGALDGRGWVDLPSGALQGDLDLRVRDARLEDQEIGRAVAHARVEGTLASPRGRLTATAEGLRVAGRPLDRVDVEAEGPVREPEVSAVAVGPGLPRIEARASLTLGGAIDVGSPAVILSRDGEKVVAVADRIRAAGGAVDVTGIEVRGAGEPLRGEAHLRPRSVRLRLSTPGMDLTPLLHVAGAPPVARGNLWLDVDLRSDPAGTFGRASARVEADRVLLDQPGRARLHLGFDGRRVDGTASLTAGDASAGLTLTRVTLAGSPLEERSWRRATGVVDLDADVPLASLTDLLPAAAAPFEGMGGAVTVQARVSRRRPGALPDVTLDATTRDLSLVAKSATPRRLEGADVRLTASIEGSRDRVSVEGELDDDDGPIAHFVVDAQPSLEEIARAPARLAPILERMPVRALVDVPERDLATWPAALRPPVLRGRVQGQAEMTGALVDPRIRVHALAQGVQTTLSRSAVPFDGSLEATYDGHAVIARAIASDASDGGGVVLDARSDLDVRVADLLERPAGGVPWDADATVALHRFPLQGVPPVADAGVGGFATGVVALEGLHRDARIDADLTLSRLHLANACFDDGWLHLRADGRTLDAALGLGRPGASAAASIRAASRWGASLRPAIDTSQPIDASLNATNFRAGALLPLLRGSVNQLDGRIDANARLRVDPNLATSSMDGEIRLTGGVVELPAIGERLHDVTATVSMRPWGTLRVDDITARGPTGRLTASAQAVFDGLHLRSASAEVDIPSEQRMPLTVEGVSLGEASAHLHADATMSPDRRALDVAVKVSRLDMRLPQSSGHAVQSLDPAPNIVVGAYEPDGRFVELPMHARQKPRPPGSTELRIAVDLGDNATLRRDANLDVQLTGTPRAVVDDVPRVDGAVRVVRGWVDVFGKRFTLDPASTIAFTGDPDNPQLVVTASYDSPDGTHIFADVLGPAKKPKIALRSDPPRPQDTIVGLLLFGSEEGFGTPAPSQQPDPTQRAAGLAAGPVTEALNKALSGITALDLSTRIDTSQATNPRPELDVRVSNEVVARVTVQTGMPAPGELPDRTMLTLDWRFHPRWSIESTVGDEGSTLVDVLWRHRY